jgi:hypothetical protein
MLGRRLSAEEDEGDKFPPVKARGAAAGPKIEIKLSSSSKVEDRYENRKEERYERSRLCDIPKSEMRPRKEAEKSPKESRLPSSDRHISNESRPNVDDRKRERRKRVSPPRSFAVLPEKSRDGIHQIILKLFLNYA